MRRNFLALFLISVFTLAAVAATVTATNNQPVAAKKATTRAAAAAKTAATTDEAKKAVTNKLCPVSGGPVSEKYRAEYKGLYVYVCCEGCLNEFKADPEKFVA